MSFVSLNYMKGYRERKRVLWIDLWKGFMLLVVCLDHFCMPWRALSLIIPVHVASFFFLSGYLYSQNTYSFRFFIVKKFRSLLFPYIALSFLFLLLTPKLYCPSNNMFLKDAPVFSSSWHFLWYSLEAIFLKGSSAIGTGSLWFVFVLFWVELVLRMVCNQSIVVVLLSATFFLLLGWYYNINHISLLFRIEVICTASFISIFGFLSQRVINKFYSYPSIALLGLCVVLFIPYLYSLNVNGSIHLHSNSLCDNLIGYLITIVSGMYMFACFFIFTARYLKKEIVLPFIARNGIIILAAHYYVDRMSRYFFLQYVDTYMFPYFELMLAIIICVSLISLVNKYCPIIAGKA